VREFPSAVPGFLPGLAVSVLIALGAARRVAIALRASQLLAFGLVVSVGAILAATLTPNVGSLEPPPGNTFCDLTRMSLAPLEELLSLNSEPSLNVLLFLPLGLVMGLLPRSAGKVALLAGAIALPAAVEFLQGMLTPLNRSCSSADVVDNLTGLAAGFALGSAAGWLWGRLSRTGEP
jgi:glycopeptide antibiotics resistance protein